METASGTLLDQLLGINVLLVVFNMIPAFPMDGGRVLRAAAGDTNALPCGDTHCCQDRASNRGALWFVSGLTSCLSAALYLGFIAIFVFLGAQQELAYAQFRETAQNLRVGQAMITRFQALPISLRVA